MVYIIIYSKDIHFNWTQTCRYDNWPVQSFLAARQQNADGLSFNYRASDAMYFESRSSQRLLNTWHYARALHITRYKYLCQFFHSHFCRLDVFVGLPIYLKKETQSFGLMCRISQPVFSVFHNYCQRVKYMVLFLHFEIFSAFTSQATQGIASSRLPPSMYWSDEFLNRSAKSLDNQASPRAPTFENVLHKLIFAPTCIPSNSLSI